MKNNTLKINEADNVVVALQDLSRQTIIVVGGISILLTEDIPAKHKFFISNMQAGEEVIMYGVLVCKVQHAVMAGYRAGHTHRQSCLPYYQDSYQF